MEGKIGKYGRFTSKKTMEKAQKAGLTENDFEGEGKISINDVKEKLGKKSAYGSMFYNGDNEEKSEYLGQLFTRMHSEKIKAGNSLEIKIGEDICEYSDYTFYKKKIINDPELNFPCVIQHCEFTKTQYEKYGLVCKNKKKVEIDFVVVDKHRNVFIFEIKNGCDFDTKKSKGEVQSLEITKTLCKNLGFNNVECYICCYDARKISDVKIKTQMGTVGIILYEEFAQKCNLNGNDSRTRIDHKIQSNANKNIAIVEGFFLDYLKNYASVEYKKKILCETN